MKEVKLVYVRLTTGEAVVTELDYISADRACFKKPLQIYIDKQSGVSELVLAPWLPVACTEIDHVELDRDKILYVLPMIPKVVNYIAGYAARLYNIEVEEIRDATPLPEDEAARAIEQLQSLISPQDKKKLS